MKSVDAGWNVGAGAQRKTRGGERRGRRGLKKKKRPASHPRVKQGVSLNYTSLDWPQAGEALTLSRIQMWWSQGQGPISPGRPPSCAQTDGPCLQPPRLTASPEGRTPTLHKNNSPSLNFRHPKKKPKKKRKNVSTFTPLSFAFRSFLLFFFFLSQPRWLLEKYVF